MATRSIVLQPHEVRAVLAGTLRELWRPCKQGVFPGKETATAIYPAREHGWIAWSGAWPASDELAIFTKQQYAEGFLAPYDVSDHLIVKEVWAYAFFDGAGTVPIYRADSTWDMPLDMIGPWRSSVTMPPALSRISLAVEAVEPRLVESITEDEAQATGFKGEEKQIWWQGYDGRFTDGNGNLVHQQYPGDPAPEWMLEPKKMIVSTEFPARNNFRFDWTSRYRDMSWAWRIRVTSIAPSIATDASGDGVVG